MPMTMSAHQGEYGSAGEAPVPRIFFDLVSNTNTHAARARTRETRKDPGAAHSPRRHGC